MTANGLPTVKVELDDVNNGGTWPYDVTAYYRWAEGYTLTPRGRAGELQAPTQVTCTLTLVNTDGRFSLGSTTGGYGAINVGRGIRVTATPQGGAASTRFTGFVFAWPTAWPAGGGEHSVAAITAVDAMGPWTRRVLRSIPEEEILRDGPVFYYTFGEPAGSKVAFDSSANSYPNMVITDFADPNGTNPVFGSATGPPTDGLTAVQFAGSGKQFAAPGMPKLISWVEVTFNTSAAGGLAGNLGTVDDLFNKLGLQLDTSGNIVGLGGGFTLTGPSVIDGHTHTAAVDLLGAGGVTLWLDGSIVATSGTAGTAVSPYSVYIGTFYTGAVSHFAAGLNIVDPGTRFVQHNTAMKTGFDGEATGRRIERLSAYEGSSPASMLDTSQSTVPFLDIAGKTVAEAIQQVADAEAGTAYVDGQGRTIAHNRIRGPLKVTPDLVLDSSSDVISGDLIFEGDDQQIVNYATGSLVGDSTQQVLSKSSTVKGRYQAPISEYLLATLAEVLDRMSWVVNTHAEPVPRIPALVLDLAAADASVQASILALDVDSRVQLTGLPTQTPGGTTADLSVIGYAETCSLAGWTWSGNCTPWLAYVQAAVLDNATYGRLDSTARLGI